MASYNVLTNFKRRFGLFEFMVGENDYKFKFQIFFGYNLHCFQVKNRLKGSPMEYNSTTAPVWKENLWIQQQMGVL